MEFIRIRDVEKTYPTGVTALYGLNLEIKKGDFVFIIGASGSGKSTLMKMLYREEKASNGEIIIGYRTDQVGEIMIKTNGEKCKIEKFIN